MPTSDDQARKMFADHSVDAAHRLDSWDAERRELLVLACMDCLWTARDTTEWYSRDRRSSYDLDDLNKFVERYGPDEEDKRGYWRGFAINLDDLSSRTVLCNYKGEEVDPETVPARDTTTSKFAAPSPAPSLRASSSDGEGRSDSPSSCSPRSAKSARGRDCSDSNIVVVTDPGARDADDEEHLSVDPAKSASPDAAVGTLRSQP